MCYRDVRLNQLLRIYVDGIPLDLASSLLPYRTRWQISLLSHIHLHAWSQKRYGDRKVDFKSIKLSHTGFSGLINNLESTIRHLKWQPQGTEWANYYLETNYSQDAMEHKKQIVTEFLNQLHSRNVWDIGANVGVFSRVASDKGMPIISFDSDPAAVEINYLECCKNKETNILPLVVDLTNPSPSLGWQNRERMSLIERGPADTVLALALVHHLAISNNVPFHMLAAFFGNICNSLIIEFVPKTDSQVQRLMVSREDIFPDYNQPTFEAEFSRFFNIQSLMKINGSERTLYLMNRISK
jgi:ribosomal protein L11 methylase PrmA